MAFEFLGYQFDGAYQSPDSLEAKAGVYVVWSRCDEDEKWTVLDVGESEDVRSRIKNHDRKDCWEEHSPCEIYYSAVYNLQKTARVEIERRIRRLTKPPCGEY